MDETVLLKELQNPKTSERAFRKLISLYKERLYWHIRKIVKNHDDTDDVLQNTFIKVYQNIQSFKGESQLYTWLYRIATNESLTFIKKQSKILQIEDEEWLEIQVNSLKADPYFEGDEIQYKLQLAMAQLPKQQQLVFQMRYFDDMKYDAIAEVLKTSVGGLKANYHHAVKKIEAFIKEN